MRRLLTFFLPPFCGLPSPPCCISVIMMSHIRLGRGSSCRTWSRELERFSPTSLCQRQMRRAVTALSTFCTISTWKSPWQTSRCCCQICSSTSGGTDILHHMYLQLSDHGAVGLAVFPFVTVVTDQCTMNQHRQHVQYNDEQLTANHNPLTLIAILSNF